MIDLRSHIRPGAGIWWGQAAAEATPLVDALLDQDVEVGRVFCGLSWHRRLQGLNLVSYGAMGELRRVRGLEVVPAHYSVLPRLFAEGLLPRDVGLVQVSPPDPDGRCSLGIGTDYTADAIRHTPTLIAEINHRMPATRGTPGIPMDRFAAVIETDRPLPGAPGRPPSAAPDRSLPDPALPDPAPPGAPAPKLSVPRETIESGAGGHAPTKADAAVADYAASPPAVADAAIAAHVAALVADGDTIQTGVGALPAAILDGLSGHRDLGFHSGMLTDGVLDLIEKGVITGSRKEIDQGLAVTGQAFGSAELYDRLAGLPIEFRPASYTHDAAVLSRLRRLVSINSAIEVDLTGQVNAETAGSRYLGGVGGQADFSGAAARTGARSIIAVRAKGIVPQLHGPVTTARADVDVVVTELGVAELRGCPLSERARRLAAIAAPKESE